MILRFFAIVAKRKFDTEPLIVLQNKGFSKCLAKSDKQKGIFFYLKSTLKAVDFLKNAKMK